VFFGQRRARLGAGIAGAKEGDAVDVLVRRSLRRGADLLTFVQGSEVGRVGLSVGAGRLFEAGHPLFDLDRAGDREARGSHRRDGEEGDEDHAPTFPASTFQVLGVVLAEDLRAGPVHQ
jgi:hypothetical protein